MTLADKLFVIEFPKKGILFCYARICSQSHGSTLLHSFLVRHDIYDAVLSFWKELRGVGLLQAQHISCKFDDSDLHSKTDSQEWDIVLPGPLYSSDLPFNSSVTKASRDKDAVNASMLCCEMTAWYKAKGQTLAHAMDALYEKYGYYRNDLASFTFEGAEGMQKMASIMENLRANPPKTLDGKAVVKVVDYQTGVNGLPKSNVLEFQTDATKVLVRPSGTEPKVKVYLSARAANMAAAVKLNQQILEELTGKYLK